MARLVSSDTRIPLRSRHLVGRAPSCDLSIPDRSVSGEHAALRWTGDHWEIQDLGSRNGTAVDGEPLATGERLALRAGAVLSFGRCAERWTLEDARAPEPFAISEGGRWVEGEDGLLVLPSPDQPALLCFEDAEGDWVAETESGAIEVADRDRVEAEGQRWRLHLPHAVEQTLDVHPSEPGLGEVRLEFAHSLDEEHVELTVVHGPRRMPLSPRAHGYMLLVMARLRLADQSSGDLSPSEHGWIYQDELLRQLGSTREQLHMQVYRARRQLSEAGVRGAARLVERRRGTNQLRIGVTRLSVLPL